MRARSHWIALVAVALAVGCQPAAQTDVPDGGGACDGGACTADDGRPEDRDMPVSSCGDLPWSFSVLLYVVDASTKDPVRGEPAFIDLATSRPLGAVCYSDGPSADLANDRCPGWSVSTYKAAIRVQAAGYQSKVVMVDTGTGPCGPLRPVIETVSLNPEI